VGDAMENEFFDIQYPSREQWKRNMQAVSRENQHEGAERKRE
jgi:hypothetical protein